MQQKYDWLEMTSSLFWLQKAQQNVEGCEIPNEKRVIRRRHEHAHAGEGMLPTKKEMAASVGL